MFSCSIEGPRNFLMMFGLSLGLSLPAGRSNPRIRFLASAKDIVESQEFDHLEMVLLPSESANQEIESDEEGSDNILNEEAYQMKFSEKLKYTEKLSKTKLQKNNPGTVYGVKVTK